MRQCIEMLNANEIEDAIGTALAGRDVEGVVSAYLFGSRAAARSHRESDVDVAVLLSRAAHPGASQRFEARLRLSAVLARALATGDVDVVILNDAPPTLARAIISAGRRVFCRDSEADRAFVRTTLLRAADLDPFLRRARRIKLQSIRR